MGNKQTLLNIVACAFAMTVTIVGIAIRSGYLQSANPDVGYPLIGIGGFFTVFFMIRLMNS